MAGTSLPFFNLHNRPSPTPQGEFRNWLSWLTTHSITPDQMICILDITPKDLFKRVGSPGERIGTHELEDWENEWDSHLLNKNAVQDQLEDVVFLQIVTVSKEYVKGDIAMALMLRANEDGTTYLRVGIVEVPDYGDLAEFDWETKDFTIV
jgi:hypothetical protein